MASLESLLADAAAAINAWAALADDLPDPADLDAARSAMRALNLAAKNLRLMIANAQRRVDAGTDPVGAIRSAWACRAAARELSDLANDLVGAAVVAARHATPPVSLSAIGGAMGVSKSYAQKWVEHRPRPAAEAAEAAG